jgi:hypothetical protein
VEGLQEDQGNYADELPEVERVIGFVMKADEGDVRRMAEAIVLKRDDELLGRGESGLRDKLLQAACHILECTMNDRKKGVPRQQHGLPALWRKRPPRRVVKQEGRASPRRDCCPFCLLPPCELRTGPAAISPAVLCDTMGRFRRGTRKRALPLLANVIQELPQCCWASRNELRPI